MGFIGGKILARLVTICIFFIKGIIPVTGFTVKDQLGIPDGVAPLIEHGVTVRVFLLNFIAVFIIYKFFMSYRIIIDTVAVTFQFFSQAFAIILFIIGSSYTGRIVRLIFHQGLGIENWIPVFIFCFQ